MFKEFREFAIKGNVVDLAVGVIIGAAFGKIVTSLVEDIILPPIGLVLGDVDFNNLYWNLSDGSYKSLAEAKAAGAATINYGLFINHLIMFVIVAFVVFLLIKRVNAMRREPAAATPSLKECPFCIAAVPLRATRCSQCTSELGIP